VPEAARHPEVNEERATRFEPKNQIFSAPLDRVDPLAFELGRDGNRLERAHQTRIEDLDVLEAPAFERGREPGPHRFHLGQLGHGAG
jgi:hypothetical protein